MKRIVTIFLTIILSAVVCAQSTPSTNAQLQDQLAKAKAKQAEVGITNRKVIDAIKGTKIEPKEVEASTVKVSTTVQMGWFPRFFSGSLASKKIVVWGNSTVSAATEFFAELQKFGSTGDVLEGFNFTNLLNYGNNGAPLGSPTEANGLQTTGNPGGWTYPIASVISAAPDLLIIRGPLINDVRPGACDLTCATSRLTTALNTITAALPNADILLTTENSFTCVDSSHSNYISPNTAAAAQSYTDMVRQAVLAQRGQYPHVFVFDVQSALYGRQCSNMSDLMLNQLHPNTKGQRREADLIASVLGAAKFGVLPTAPASGALSDTLFIGSDLSAPDVGSGVPYVGTIVNAAAGQYRYHQFRTAGKIRWLFGTDNTTEAGADAGSNFVLQAYSDTESSLGQYVVVDRKTGKVTLLKDFLATGNAVIGGTLQTNGNITTVGMTSTGAVLGDQFVQKDDAGRMNASGIVAATGKYIGFSSTTASSGAVNVKWTQGAGVPSAGTCTTAKGGSLYSRTDGTTTTSLYVCDGATGVWTAK